MLGRSIHAMCFLKNEGTSGEDRNFESHGDDIKDIRVGLLLKFFLYERVAETE